MPFENEKVEVKVYIDGEYKRTISTDQEHTELAKDLMNLKYGQGAKVSYKVGELVKTPDQVYYLLRNR